MVALSFGFATMTEVSSRNLSFTADPTVVLPPHDSLFLRTIAAKVMIHKEPARRGSGPCSTVKWLRERGQLYLLAAFATGKIASFALSNGIIRKVSAVSVGVAVSFNSGCRAQVFECTHLHNLVDCEPLG